MLDRLPRGRRERDVPAGPRRDARTNVEGSANAVRAAAAAGVARVVYTSSSAAIGEASGSVGREDSPHRGSYLSAYERSKHLAERRVFELSRSLGVDVVAVNPSSVQGPGRATGSARLLLEVVNGRLPVLVRTTISLVDIADCSAGHVLAETRGTPGERYLLSGATITTPEAVDLLDRIWGSAGRCGSRRAGSRRPPASSPAPRRLLRRDATLCPEAVRTLLGHRYDGSKATRARPALHAGRGDAASDVGVVRPARPRPPARGRRART